MCVCISKARTYTHIHVQLPCTQTRTGTYRRSYGNIFGGNSAIFELNLDVAGRFFPFILFTIYNFSYVRFLLLRRLVTLKVTVVRKHEREGSLPRHSGLQQKWWHCLRPNRIGKFVAKMLLYFLECNLQGAPPVSKCHVEIFTASYYTHKQWDRQLHPFITFNFSRVCTFVCIVSIASLIAVIICRYHLPLIK